MVRSIKEMTEETLGADVESGAYFTAARHWYSELFHTPIAQRTYYIFIIFLALLNLYLAVISFLEVFPLSRAVPFVTYSNDIMEDIPRINKITTNASEDKNFAVMKYFVKNYVTNRESYDLSKFELLYRNIWSESSKDVFEEYKKDVDVNNPYSFYRMYTNRSRRVINILSMDVKNPKYLKPGESSQAHVIFESSVVSLANGHEISSSKWRADLTFKYTKFSVDQSLYGDNLIARFFGLTGRSAKASGERDERKVVPMTFIVSDYKVKELLE